MTDLVDDPLRQYLRRVVSDPSVAETPPEGLTSEVARRWLSLGEQWMQAQAQIKRLNRPRPKKAWECNGEHDYRRLPYPDPNTGASLYRCRRCGHEVKREVWRPKDQIQAFRATLGLLSLAGIEVRT